MKWNANWTGVYPCLCYGQWVITYDDKPFPIPEDRSKNDMNTEGTYETWSFGDDYDVEWDDYEDGLNCEDWIKENKEWISPIFEELGIPLEEMENLYWAISSSDWRSSSCGGCI